MTWIYTSMRISHLLNMLNNDDKDVRELARSSLFLDLRRRKVPGNWTLILLALASGQTGRT